MTRRKEGPRKKPGPRVKVPRLVEGVDYYCGECVGRTWVWCPWCFDGCSVCDGRGTLKCEACGGGEIPVRPPDWL